MGKKREILTSPTGPGVTGAESGVSPVRGADSAPSVTDLPRISGLPGVRPDNPDRKPPEVSPSPAPVAKRKLEHRPKPEPMSLDEKLEFLNALRLIRKQPPKVKDQKYKDLIEKLYFEWIDKAMLEILSPGAITTATQSNFTSEEAGALKVLAQTILQRQQGSAGQPQAPAPMVPRTGANPKPIGGLDPGVDSGKLKQAQLAFLQELQKMEREGPSF